VAQRDDVLALGVELRQQYSGFVRFRALLVKTLLQPPGSNLRQLLRQANLRLVGVRSAMLHEKGFEAIDEHTHSCSILDAYRQRAAGSLAEKLAQITPGGWRSRFLP